MYSNVLKLREIDLYSMPYITICSTPFAAQALQDIYLFTGPEAMGRMSD